MGKVLKRLSLLNKHYPLKELIVILIIFNDYFNIHKKIFTKGGKKVLNNMKDEEEFLQTLEEKLFLQLEIVYKEWLCIFWCFCQ